MLNLKDYVNRVSDTWEDKDTQNEIMRFKVAIANEQRRKRFDRKYLAALESLDGVITDQGFWDKMALVAHLFEKLPR